MLYFTEHFIEIERRANAIYSDINRYICSVIKKKPPS